VVVSLDRGEFSMLVSLVTLEVERRYGGRRKFLQAMAGSQSGGGTIFMVLGWKSLVDLYSQFASLGSYPREVFGNANSLA